ncbi:MAG TPA: trehalase family glycosidase [Aquihabitans sp.]|nr:trehalase family glycosidase [Aquihabitans sp.]
MDDLARQAIEVLWRNARGSWTRPSPRLYPHQWSWDAGFVAMGWAQLDPVRGVAELRSLLRGQWATGMVPQIVFDLTVARGAYEPGPNAWGTARHAPAGAATSGICQPAIHAIALARIREVAAGRAHDGHDDDGHDLDSLDAVDAGVVELYPALAAWHRWLHTARDPEGSGLVTILHPWESGLDNSPRWDAPLAAVDPGDEAEDLPRPDLTYVADPDERPTDAEYRRYRHLVDRLVAVDHDQAKAMVDHPFRVADVWSSAILAAADDALADLAVVAGRPEDADEHHAAAARTRDALDGCWDAEHARCLDVDRRTGESIEADTIAGFAPLVAGTSVDRTAILVERLWSPSFAGSPSLRWALPPSTAVDSDAFDLRAYWRGPQWPPMTWLLWWSLGRAGHRRSSERLRTTALDQLRSTGCTEYVEPRTGEPLGSDAQSWTAAVALDWLGHEP